MLDTLFVQILCIPGCILCKTQARVMPVVPQVCAKAEGWRTSEV